jgi:hypothetical protein
MRKLFLLFLSLFFITSVSDLYSQRLMRNTSVTGVTLGSNKVNRIYIPPPKEYFMKMGQKGGASLTVQYINCPETVVTSVNFAVSILEKMLPDDTRSKIIVTWKKITTSGVLANSSTAFYIAGWAIEALKPGAFYPAALAEKIAAEPLNRNSDADILLNINSNVSWYYGTDGKTPTIRYDLVTVALHEICHGLGFFDSFRIEGSNAAYGTSSIPLIYDTFVENQAGMLLTDTNNYKNPSFGLRTAITNGQAYFNGPLLKTYSQGRARLYAPSTFEAGSSIAHLDPSSTLQPNSLMTPYIDMGEAIHDPGKYTMSILGDLGWINTSIIHDNPFDTEAHVTGIPISATIISDTTYFHDRVGLVWSSDGFATSDTIFMTSPGSNDNYTATIPVSSYETRIEYYIYAMDCFSRISRLPSSISNFKYSVVIGTDTVKPVLAHYPVKYYLEKIDSINLTAFAEDNLGLDTVYIEYIVNDGLPQYLGLKYRGNFEYRNSIIPSVLSLRGGDSVRYRIIARDKSAAVNQKTLPVSGYFSSKIESVNDIAISYTTDFSDASDDFMYDGFSIQKPDGFTHFGLNTPHPYVSPEETGDSIGYVSVLRTPVKFDANGMIISYSEIVLVEPGEDGSLFGTTDFYDYVIIEGSGDYGKTWFSLTDGYDSRYKTDWLTKYNNSIVGNNSTYTGTESMLQRHVLFPETSVNIEAGDPLIVRFRLFSDPYANGWGWIIEDLHIGPLIDQVEEFSYIPFVIYPNPGNGLIRLRQNENEFIRPVRYSVFNSTGTCIINGMTTGGEEPEIDISGHSSGLYFIVFYFDSGIRTVKYSLIK